MKRCPICDSVLTRNSQYGSEYGLEEYHDSCHGCSGTAEDFTYGFTELRIGMFTVGYSWNMPGGDRALMIRVVEKICEEYRIKAQTGREG